ncbi:FAD-dependent oxidoreductase [Gordonia sp. X0973]|uniref:NAD(P)/FAD-dependent oxidoreductase n=1 Tax=Gordonia sp. X0973 TaxID=2742602 RepID=UPI0015837536|nr:FAD-dependent oxidoreductase [Gordonia sp. X0973]QKT08048.1 FAD-dependent oxidoreductase [Gordonia sp. X0973]
MTPKSFAVVGSGVAGLTAAHVLAREHRVTLFEADSRLGGHADTHRVMLPSGAELAVDTAFLVHNDRTYPTLQRLFAELGVTTRETDMSMSVRCDRTGLEYAGARGINGLFPTVATAARPRYLRMLGEIVAFHRAARRVLAGPVSDESIAGFVSREGFSDYFEENFLLPLIAAVWSCDSATAADYPARSLFTFLDHHGMLSVFGSPTWRTVAGGSATYVNAIAGRIAASGEIRLSQPVRGIRETPNGVEVVAHRAGSATTETFDAVVLAVHPHQALDLLEHSADRAQILGAMPYLAKSAVLHTDESMLPRARRARASWNYRIPDDERGAESIVVTYDVTRLMRLPDVGERMLVTMGRTDLVDPALILDEMTYEHPVYTRESVAAQARLPELNTDRIALAGAYHGWGFHEDGAASGARAAARLGVPWPAPGFGRNP